MKRILFLRWVVECEWLLVVAAAPLLLFPTRWTPLGVAAIAAIWLCRWAGTGHLGVGAAVDVPVACMLAMAGVGCYVSPDRVASLPALWRMLLGVALFYGLAHSLRAVSPGHPLPASLRIHLPAALILASLALAVLTLLGTSWSQVRLLALPQLYGRLPAWLRDLQDQNAFHPRVMGMALATWLPLPLALLAFGRQPRQRLWAGLAVLGMGVMLLLSQSLQAFVGLCCAVLFLGVCWRRWFVFTVPLLGAAGWLALGSSGWQRLALAALSVGDPLGIAAALRLDMWSRAWAMIRDMPYTGIGLDSFQLMQWHFYPGVMLGSEPHVHNLFLQVALDLGLPGLLALLWLLVGVGWAAWRAYRCSSDAGERAVLLGALAAMVSYASAGLLDTMWTAKPGVLLWVVLGLAAGLSTDVKRIQPAARSTLPLDQSPAESLRNGDRLSPTTEPAEERRTHKRHHPFTGAPSRVLGEIRGVAGHPLTILLLLVLLLVPGLLLPRQAWALNERLVRAHRILLAAERGESVGRQELTAVRDNLRWLVQGGAERASLYSLLGQAEAWLGEDGAALAAFERRVELDAQDPIASYAPFEGLRRRVAGEGARDRWEDAAWVYGHWVSRFPQRAEAHVLLALIRQQQGKSQGAAQVLRAALQQGARPRGVVEYALAQANASRP